MKTASYVYAVDEASPYERGAKRYADRYGDAKREVALRTSVVLGLVIVVVALTIGLVIVASRPAARPYVIERGDQGIVTALGLAQPAVQGSSIVTRAAVARFFTTLRTVVEDDQAQMHLARTAYAFVPKESEAFLRVAGHYKRLVAQDKRDPVSVEVLSMERLGASSNFRIELLERVEGRYETTERRLSAFATVKVAEQRGFDDLEEIVWNPTGVFITEFNLTDQGQSTSTSDVASSPGGH